MTLVCILSSDYFLLIGSLFFLVDVKPVSLNQSVEYRSHVEPGLFATSYRGVKYINDLVADAEVEKLNPVMSRDDEIQQCIEILTRQTKNNPILIGKSNVEKKAIVKGLAKFIFDQNIPDTLPKHLIELDMKLLDVDTSHRDAFDERLKSILKDIDNLNSNIILFIDQIHLVLDVEKTEDTINASDILRSLLARGQLHCIGATSLEKYQQFIEKHPENERYFQEFFVKESLIDNYFPILSDLQDCDESYFSVNQWTDILKKESSQTEDDRLLKLTENLRKKSPTGVGKTELAKTLAFELFNSTRSMISINMIKCVDIQSVKELIGISSDDASCQRNISLIEFVRQQSYSIILFDQIEKAYSKPWSFLLNIINNGYLNDENGEIVDFKNTIVIFTSNISVQIISERIQNSSSATNNTDEKLSQSIKDEVMKKVHLCLEFELLNRLNNIVFFTPLTINHLSSIISLQLKSIEEHFKNQFITISLTDKAIQSFINKNYNPNHRTHKQSDEKSIIDIDNGDNQFNIKDHNQNSPLVSSKQMKKSPSEEKYLSNH
ncbi:unnamed protein product [Rotaria sordida]|uniref:AAA+ ATPase domain-containing protein n=1 Tax=Rotaria sordida TaxID=392033 RepID=A0A814WYD7_9BILA|nr:unnamed protein product [Rotaria sordida]CAF1484235.1 unnamed protein product [Rotaria sordida]